MKFWILWGFDTVIAFVFLFFFLVGIADGSVSSFNIGLWLVILVGLIAVVGGSLTLHLHQRTGLAIWLVLLLAVPGLLAGLFFLGLIVLNPRWN